MKDADTLPVPMITMTAVVTFLWYLYGICLGDNFIVVCISFYVVLDLPRASSFTRTINLLWIFCSILIWLDLSSVHSNYFYTSSIWNAKTLRSIPKWLSRNSVPLILWLYTITLVFHLLILYICVRRMISFKIKRLHTYNYHFVQILFHKLFNVDC